jgi:hypothetical protein
MKLHFHAPLVRRIYKHSKAAQTRTPTADQTYQGEYRKDGMDLNPQEVGMDIPTISDVDLTKIPPGLWLVGGKGVFLMSNGTPGLLIGSGQEHVVAHAIEANPSLAPDWLQVTRSLFGPYQGLELLEAPFIEAMFAKTKNGIISIQTEAGTINSALPSFPLPMPRRNMKWLGAESRKTERQ